MDDWKVMLLVFSGFVAVAELNFGPLHPNRHQEHLRAAGDILAFYRDY